MSNKDEVNEPIKSDQNQINEPSKEELLQNHCDQLENQIIKERANLLNYQQDENIRFEKRLTEKEKGLLFEILSIIDNFEHTLKALSEHKQKDNQDIILGIEMIYKQFKKFLNDKDCQSFESLNQEFNPSLHEAIETIKDEKMKNNTICEEISKGYTYKDLILRPAKVKVIQNEQKQK